MIHLCPLQRLVKDLIHYFTCTVEKKKMGRATEEFYYSVLQLVRRVITSGHFSQVERVFSGAEFAATVQGHCDS